jgi:hypothetical protein
MVGLIVGVASALLVAASPQEPPRQDGWVVLPIDEYRALRARALPSTPDPAPPPVDAALTRVDYDLRVAGESVSGEARLTVDVLKQGWASVQVPAGLLVRDARLDGRPTALVEGTPPRVLLSRAGRSTLTLDVVVPLASAAGSESMTLPASGSALSAVTLTVPRTGVSLAMTGGFVAEETESAAESRWVVYGMPGRPLTFSWKHRVDDHRAAQPLHTRARITELVALGEDSTQVTASVAIDVMQGLARDAVITLPEGFVVNQVAGPTLADWDVGRNALTVTFLEPVADRASVVVTGEVRTPREGVVAVPIVRVAAAERESGGVAVDVSGPGEIGQREPRGLEPADASDLGDVVAGHESASMAAFRFTPLAGAAARSLTVNVTRYTPKAVLVASVEEARYDALVGEDGKLLVRARYAVRNNQRSFLAVSLPPRAILWSASLGGRPVRPGVSASGGLLLPLQKSRTTEDAPAFVIELLYLQRLDAWTERGDARVELPAIDLPILRTGVAFRYSPRYEVDARAGAFRVADDQGPWSAALRGDLAIPVAVPPPPPAAERNLKDAQALIDRFQKESGRTRPGVVPIAIAFPEIGPVIFLAAELTPEAQPPAFDVQYRRSVHASDERGGR